MLEVCFVALEAEGGLHQGAAQAVAPSVAAAASLGGPAVVGVVAGAYHYQAEASSAVVLVAAPGA